MRSGSTPRAVWAALLDPNTIVRWMGLNKRPYRDRGTVLNCEPERLLRYNYWSSWSRQIDSEKTRSVITLTLTPDGDAATVLEVQHDNLTSDETFGHSRFSWRNALTHIKDIAERG